MKEGLDKYRNKIRRGDRVKVVSLDPNVEELDPKTRTVFEAALGKEFDIYEIDEYGSIWVSVRMKDGVHDIALERETVEKVQ